MGVTTDGTRAVTFDGASDVGVFSGVGDICSFGGASFVAGISFGGTGSNKHGSKDDNEVFLAFRVEFSSLFGVSSFLIFVSFCVDNN